MVAKDFEEMEEEKAAPLPEKKIFSLESKHKLCTYVYHNLRFSAIFARVKNSYM